MMDVMNGIKAFRIRYELVLIFLFKVILVAMRLYRGAVMLLKFETKA